jgi:glycosyltransferase involved in cell wall biosynthesis
MVGPPTRPRPVPVIAPLAQRTASDRANVKLSIAMATYNGARFLREQLASLAAQTSPPDELVVCDDGSTDATLDVLREFATSAPFEVRVEPNARRLGVSENFLRTASLCRGDWIAYCDQDDAWLPGKLAAVRAVVARRPAAVLVAHRAAIADGALRPTGELLHVPAVRRTTIVPRLARGFWSYPYGFTMTFSARLLRAVPAEGRPVESHDRWIAILAGILGETVYLAEPLALYRRHGENYSQLHAVQGPAHDLRSAAERGELDRAAALVEQLWRFLVRSAGSAAPGDAVPLEEASELYRRLARALALRADLCRRGEPWSRRARRFAELLGMGGYAAHRSGGLGWRAALKDAVRVVVL